MTLGRIASDGSSPVTRQCQKEVCSISFIPRSRTLGERRHRSADPECAQNCSSFRSLRWRAESSVGHRCDLPRVKRSDSTSLVLLGTGDRIFFLSFGGAGEYVPPPPSSGHLPGNSDFSARNFRHCLYSRALGKRNPRTGPAAFVAIRTQPIFPLICPTKHQFLLHLTSYAHTTPTFFGCICRRILIAIVTGIPRIPLPPETWCQMSP